VNQAQGVAERADALERCFRAIERERMAGLPFLHPGLRVQVIGLAPQSDEPAVLSGILLTPWFMNLVRLPLRRLDALAGLAAGWAGVGLRVSRRVGDLSLDMLGGVEPGPGVFESASLFSPMGEFADQAAAVAAAQEVLHQLHRPAPQAAATPPAMPVPSRRGFLMGRSTGGLR
jgi:[NiFe] hydrogenase assembly HybE family chaperone